jgi:hypothetical protein
MQIVSSYLIAIQDATYSIEERLIKYGYFFVLYECVKKRMNLNSEDHLFFNK